VSFTLTGRRNGKTAASMTAVREALERGQHVHIARQGGVWCVDGPDDCQAAKRCTLADLESGRVR
jgi:hypothetical protein